jgi:DNA-3-methyladenine glycosylase
MSRPVDSSGQPRAWRTIPRKFFADPPEIVAPSLLGKLLARRTSDGLWLAGRIVEVEAYLGPHITATPDPAAHSFRGVTERNQVMFGPPGHAYVYFIYGMYFCMNVTCEPEGNAGCILIRALEPVLGREIMAANRRLSAKSSDAHLTGGPGRLCRALGITRPEHNGLDLLSPSSELRLFQDRWTPSQSEQVEITPRIGIRHAADLPLRFSLANHPAVSRIRQKRPPV